LFSRLWSLERKEEKGEKGEIILSKKKKKEGEKRERTGAPRNVAHYVQRADTPVKKMRKEKEKRKRKGSNPKHKYQGRKRVTGHYRYEVTRRN